MKSTSSASARTRCSSSSAASRSARLFCPANGIECASRDDGEMDESPLDGVDGASEVFDDGGATDGRSMEEGVGEVGGSEEATSSMLTSSTGSDAAELLLSSP